MIYQIRMGLLESIELNLWRINRTPHTLDIRSHLDSHHRQRLAIMIKPHILGSHAPVNLIHHPWISQPRIEELLSLLIAILDAHSWRRGWNSQIGPEIMTVPRTRRRNGLLFMESGFGVFRVSRVASATLESKPARHAVGPRLRALDLLSDRVIMLLEGFALEEW
jgi:hypothetical protein